jgi:hypothetical protein
MFKLTVVGGPAKGKSYAMKDGENSIGRIDGNEIVLQSQKVSKKHCVLVVDNTGVQVKDAGSSNGTFVNGVLTKAKAIKPGDRVSVGEYVFELVKVEAPKPKLAVVPAGGAMGGIPAMPGQTGMTAAPPTGASTLPNAAAPPKSLQEKVKFYFETYVINFVYNLNEKHEWRTMMGAMFVVLVVASAVLAVYPVVDRVNEKLENEAAGRAFLLARQMVDRNTQYIFERMESKVDVGYIEKEPGVLSAYITDMDGRIIAPARKMNQNLTEANEAAFSAIARVKFNESETRERFSHMYENMIGVAVPLRVFNQSAGKNTTVAAGLVFFDPQQVMFDSGTEALAYAQALILSAIVGIIIFFSLYRLTLRPLNALNEDIDQVLKGNATSVNKKFKMEEIGPLIDVVNAALQRASGGGASGGGANPEEVIAMLKFAANAMVGVGMALLGGDKKILHWNATMEEFTAIRADGAIGNEVSGVARDAAFGAFMEDLLAKAPLAGQEPVGDDFEFSGTQYRLECLAFGTPGAIQVYAITAKKPG